jgi:hypothetical protein
MENKQTAVEKLTAMQHLINWIDSDCTPMDCVMKAKELLQMEKEQMFEFAEQVLLNTECSFRGLPFMTTGYDNIYNETYGTK